MNAQAAPPRPPAIAPSIRLTKKQWVALPFFFAVPVLTLFNTFGETQVRVHAAAGPMELTVTYPSRFRYRQIEPMRISVRNRTAKRLDTVMVNLDTSYISRFSSVRFVPPATRAFDVLTTDLHPGESRLISVELLGDRYGRHAGTVTASTRTDTVRVSVHTIVFP